MDVEVLVQQRQALRRRVTELYQRSTREKPSELLGQAFEELQQALEQLQNAEECIRKQQQEIAIARDASDQERVSTTDVFNGVPMAYVITGIDGTIRRLNHAAVSFFNQTEKFLLGKSLGLFVPEGERRTFRADLERIRDLANAEHRTLRLQPYGSRPQWTTLTVGAARDRAGRVVALHWLINCTDVHTAKKETQLRERFA